MNLSLLFAVAIIFFILGLIAGLLFAGLRENPLDAGQKAEGHITSDPLPALKEEETTGRADSVGMAQPAAKPEIFAEPVEVGSGRPVDLMAPVDAMGSVSEVQPVSPSLVAAIARAIGGKAATPDNKPVSMVTQIDDILQEKLPSSPLAGRTIRLFELPGHEIQVVVDAEQFRGIDAVPDEDVRGIIRQSVADWEKRTLRRS